MAKKVEKIKKVTEIVRFALDLFSSFLNTLSTRKTTPSKSK